MSCNVGMGSFACASCCWKDPGVHSRVPCAYENWLQLAFVAAIVVVVAAVEIVVLAAYVAPAATVEPAVFATIGIVGEPSSLLPALDD